MNINKQQHENCFKMFKQPLNSYTLPEFFTFPFNYDPHPLCILAAKELQDYLEKQTDFSHNFGIEDGTNNEAIGKMFGVLVVKNSENKIGYLTAYSGKLAGRNDHAYFVPPLFDLLNKDGFYRIGEDEITKINLQVDALEKNADYLKCKTDFQVETEQFEKQSIQMRKEMKVAKKKRKERRDKAREELPVEKFEKLKEELKNESLDRQYEYKRFTKNCKQKLEILKLHLDSYNKRILLLKEERKKKSAALQKEIFEKFNFLNYNGTTKSLYEIFFNTAKKIPPAGAGECSAPKLLQYAYQNNLTPLAMAEFWWGASPKSEIRKHKSFYPACRGKCEPILTHMLEGLNVEKNPMLNNLSQNKNIEILFEDDSLLVINKPAELLSVPGKNVEDSVYSRIKNKYPEATGPLIVHRLDMSTSGLMVIAKSKEVHKNLQSQFSERKVKKRYVALLDGNLDKNEGLIDLPLRVDLDNRPHQLVCYEYGKRALTTWKVVERINDQTKVHFFPITGRTHQLRVHAAHQLGLNSPIVGDDLYGKRAERLCLHADFIKFVHPVSGKIVKFQLDAEF